MQNETRNDWVTTYKFKVMQVWELIKMALKPPVQMEAVDWKALAKELAGRVNKSHWRYQWVTRKVDHDFEVVEPYEVHLDEQGLWARTENPVTVSGEDANEARSVLVKLLYDHDRFGVIPMSELDALIGTHPGLGDEYEGESDDSAY